MLALPVVDVNIKWEFDFFREKHSSEVPPTIGIRQLRSLVFEVDLREFFIVVLSPYYDKKPFKIGPAFGCPGNK